ncbi:MAG: hypothetical protein A3F70_18065 [Acidobacteria bacterium RIFCSPLOWO2_12_FULL_67_14]|nr:MAG: hypothetical protein A3F70_18065 [Acidobacteria bacterium RIFCSPLOWO2_12_FULL_67_14]OGB88494.1 MAG: hypothetical protein A3H39_12755 [candidate division NC10 bacterium RIFCSPLOWO2_02_FULL_66_22]
MGALADRFIQFCRSVPGAEEIDALPLAPDQKALKLRSADFFFENRTIIFEIKSLESDTSPKFIAFLKNQGFDLRPGEYIVQDLFASRPNSDELFRTATDIIATAVADGLADGNRQIRDTKTLFSVDNADGVVVLLNGLVEILGPQLVLKRIIERLRKLRQDGSPYHAHVSQIVYFSEKHLVETQHGDSAIAFPVANELVPPVYDVGAFVSHLVEGWAKFNGRWFKAMGGEIVV